MSMTVEEAIEKLEFLNEALNFQRHDADECSCALQMGMDAIKEIQQYRAIIGLTPEDLKSLEKDEIQTIGDALNAFSEWSQYKEIGTVEELQALKEKATAKSMKMVNGVYSCCSCGLAFAVVNQGYCINCGQNLIEQSEGRE